MLLLLLFILYQLATMSPFGWHPPHLVDNTDILSGGPALTRDSVGFLDFVFVFVPCKFYILVSFSTLVLACVISFLIVGCIVSFSSKRNFSCSCFMLLVLCSFFSYNLKLYWAENVHFLSFSYTKIEETCQILFFASYFNPFTPRNR